MDTALTILADVGVVVIGRNEARVLRQSLTSIPAGVAGVVYADSHSTDDSVAIARDLGVTVTELGGGLISAGRARNAGFARLLECVPNVRFVQFIDGDCVLDPAWLGAATEAINADRGLAAVWGLRRERRPDASVYNRICDLEWRVPGVGETAFFGGDALVRVEAFKAAGGYDPDVVCSEDQELGTRLRSLGWRIYRLDAVMASHDARMTHVWQWWRRGVRRGTGYVQTWSRHRSRSDTLNIVRVAWWAALLPLLAAALAPFTRGLSLLILLLYPLRVLRIAATYRHGHALVWGVHCVASAFPYFVGVVRQAVRQGLGLRPRIIEYQHAPARPTQTDATRLREPLPPPSSTEAR
ncbi:MAG: glycosyltransferase [Planctomycetota bacterium]|nr:glycosyltransferase [Planctomycetota bacterium]